MLRQPQPPALPPTYSVPFDSLVSGSAAPLHPERRRTCRTSEPGGVPATQAGLRAAGRRRGPEDRRRPSRRPWPPQKGEPPSPDRGRRVDDDEVDVLLGRGVDHGPETRRVNVRHQQAHPPWRRSLTGPSHMWPPRYSRWTPAPVAAARGHRPPRSTRLSIRAHPPALGPFMGRPGKGSHGLRRDPRPHSVSLGEIGL